MGLFVRQLGLEPERLDEFYAWKRAFIAPTMEERIACGEKIGGYLFEVVTQHVDNPKDDIVDMLLNVDVEERSSLRRCMRSAICCFSPASTPSPPCSVLLFATWHGFSTVR
ncbi:MAG: hypothetical protein CM15mP74_25550 [Halieaceae bacterium]|nr:MAG: hypothetical protein CM15mP74_25550 [Halieaceae bacterium]